MRVCHPYLVTRPHRFLGLTGPVDEFDVCGETDLSADTTPANHQKKRLWSDPAGNYFFGDDTTSVLTIADTGGCSASQIIGMAGLGSGHSRFGISKSAMTAFIASI